MYQDFWYILAHAQTVDTRPSPPPEGLGTRLALKQLGRLGDEARILLHYWYIQVNFYVHTHTHMSCDVIRKLTTATSEPPPT